MLIHSFCETQSKKWRNAGLEKRKIGEDKVVIGEYFKDCPEGKGLYFGVIPGGRTEFTQHGLLGEILGDLVVRIPGFHCTCSVSAPGWLSEMLQTE